MKKRALLLPIVGAGVFAWFMFGKKKEAKAAPGPGDLVIEPPEELPPAPPVVIDPPLPVEVPPGEKEPVVIPIDIPDPEEVLPEIPPIQVKPPDTGEPVVLVPPTPPEVLPPQTPPIPPPVEPPEQPVDIPADTVEVLRVMLSAEATPNWKRREPLLGVWQKTRGLTDDQRFGPGTALRMAQETGLLPVIRFWPRGAIKEQGAVEEYQAALLQVAASKPEPHRAQLQAAANREQGQGFGRAQTPITPLISI